MNEKALEIIKNEGKYTIDDLLGIMEILRSPDGCPWDKVQTHESIRSNFIEETYEVIEAIDNKDPVLMREELGDVLLQVVFHSSMANGEGDFDFSDVTDEVCRKLIERHPHIFSDTVAGNADEVLKNWDAIKEETKKRDSAFIVLDSVAKSLPSLMRAEKIAKKAEKRGYPDEVTPEIASKIEKSPDKEKEIGKLLYDLCVLSQKYSIDAEKALYDKCNEKIETVKKEENK